jgi:hypothetical protein
MFTLVIWKPDVVIAPSFPSGYVTSPVCSVAYMVSFLLWYNTVVSLMSTQAPAVEQSLAEFCIYNAVVWWWLRLSEMKPSLLS